ncbi:MAG: BsaWI family type II restriction enzyme [Brevinematia bacterium]
MLIIQVLFIISSKTTLRERIAQTGYWKLKLLQSEITKHIKVFFMTIEGEELKNERSKNRAIVEIDTDGAYLINIEKESEKVKNLASFLKDIENSFVKNKK